MTQKYKKIISYIIYINCINFILFALALIILAIVVLANVKKSTHNDDIFKIEKSEYDDFLTRNIIPVIFIVLGISSIIYDLNKFAIENPKYFYCCKNEKNVSQNTYNRNTNYNNNNDNNVNNVRNSEHNLVLNQYISNNRNNNESIPEIMEI